MSDMFDINAFKDALAKKGYTQAKLAKEIGNKEIKELFAMSNSRTLARYKREVRQVQAQRGILTSQMHTVNTAVAYDVWGIDVADLEKRRDKLKKLGLSA